MNTQTVLARGISKELNIAPILKKKQITIDLIDSGPPALDNE